MTSTGYLYENKQLIQEYDIIDSSESIVDCAMELNVDEIILIGNGKYCAKKKSAIEKGLNEVSTHFDYKLNITVRVDDLSK